MTVKDAVKKPQPEGVILPAALRSHAEEAKAAAAAAAAEAAAAAAAEEEERKAAEAAAEEAALKEAEESIAAEKASGDGDAGSDAGDAPEGGEEK